VSQIRHLPVAPTHTRVQNGGDVVDRHRHDDHQLVYVSRGVSAVRTQHGAWVASGDRALWVPAHTWHEHRFYGSTSFHTVGFDAADMPLPIDAPTIIAVDPLLRELIVTVTADGLTDVEAGRIRAVLADRMHRAAQAPFVLPVPADPRLADACRTVEADLSRPRSLEELAGRVNASERTLSRLFRTEFGLSYPQWRTRTRLFAAMVLLAEGHSVTETARATGWATTSAFVDVFARAMGSTPGAYRVRRTE
jgi:AraC-like DNA-binding protein